MSDEGKVVQMTEVKKSTEVQETDPMIEELKKEIDEVPKDITLSLQNIADIAYEMMIDDDYEAPVGMTDTEAAKVKFMYTLVHSLGDPENKKAMETTIAGEYVEQFGREVLAEQLKKAFGTDEDEE